MPVYNVAGFVGACLESLKAQSFADFEAIVIDDGSTDESRAEAVAAMLGDARFRMFSGPNGGLSAARNLGLGLARGGFIAFLDGDDRYAPEFLERMHGALVASDADWVACGLRYVPVAGSGGSAHSAIHGAEKLTGDATPRLYDLTDWREAVNHFPSAWNKLYRRELIAGLRFDEGMAFEDHAFFWQAAARTRSLLHLPEPLYLQTVDREGQITRDGGETVFQQFAVLERLHGLLGRLGDREGAEAGFRKLATRLVFERGGVIADPQRMARYVAGSRAFFARHGIDWERERELPVLNRFGRLLLGRLPVSVVVASDGKARPLKESLASLAGQEMVDFDVLVVSDGQARLSDLGKSAEAAGMDSRISIVAPGPGTDPEEMTPAARAAAARNRGLAVARGDFVVFLDAGDRLLPGALGYWLEAVTSVGGREGADMGFSGFRIGSEQGLHHRGVHGSAAVGGRDGGPMSDLAVLDLHSLPSAKIFRRGFLQAEGLGFADHAWQGWALVLDVARRASHVIRLDWDLVIQGEGAERRGFWRRPAALGDLAAAVDAMAAGLDPVLRQRLLTRAIWEKALFANFPDAAARDGFRQAAAELWRERQADLPEGAQVFDPYVGRDFRDELAGKTG